MISINKIKHDINIIEKALKNNNDVWFETKLISGDNYIKVIVYDNGQSAEFDTNGVIDVIASRYKKLNDCSDWMYINPNDFVKNVLTDLGINNPIFTMEITQEYYEELSNIFTDAYFENIKIV